MGDVNAKGGADNTGREDHMAKNGIGNNERKWRTVCSQFCGLNSMIIGGTIFVHKDIHKIYMDIPTDRKNKNQSDHIAINKK